MTSALDKMMGRAGPSSNDPPKAKPNPMESMMLTVLAGVGLNAETIQGLGLQAQAVVGRIENIERNAVAAVNQNRAIMRRMGFTDEQIAAAELGQPLGPGNLLT